MSDELTIRQILWLRTACQKNAILFFIPPSNKELNALAERGLMNWSTRKDEWTITKAGRDAYRANRSRIQPGTMLAV